MVEERGDYKTRFTAEGKGTRAGQKPISVLLPTEPIDIDGIVRSLPNRSEFIRQAVIEKLERDGLLPKEE